MPELNALESLCQQLEQALAVKDTATLIRLDGDVQKKLQQIKDDGITMDRQLLQRLQAVYPLMIELCSREREHLAEQLKVLNTRKMPLQAYKTVATTR